MAIGVVVNEKDLSLYSSNSQTSPVLAVIGAATKGPLDTPTLCFSQKDFKEKFGLLHTDCYATYAAQHFLAQAGRLYFIRVADDTAKKATVNIAGTVSSSSVPNALVLETSDVGTAYNDYIVQISNVTTNEFNLTLKDKSNGTPVISLKNLSLDSNSDNYIGKKLNSSVLRLSSLNSVDAKLTEGSYKLSGGLNGTSDISNKTIDVLDKLNTDTITIDLISTPGESSASVIQKGLTVAGSRGDCIYLVDPPQGLTYQEVADWHNGTGEYQDDHAAFNSSFGALYWSWQYIQDEINNEEILVPPSVVVAPVYARSVAMSAPWYAPAGLTRGIIRNAIRSEDVPDSNAVNFLYEGNNSINCIITHDTAGLVVFGQKTLSRVDNSLNRINVRNLVTYIKRFVKQVCQFLVFEPNDYRTWTQFYDLIDPKLENLKVNRGLYDYRIVKGNDIVSDDDIDNYRMPAQILIQPTKSAEYLPIDIVLTSTGAEFNDYATIISE